MKEASKRKLEKELISMLNLNTDFNIMVWVKNGLQLFHDMSYQDSLKIKLEMIVEIKDGYNILYNNQNYWLPKNIDPFFEK